MFNALVVSKNEEGQTSAAVTQISMDDLPDGEVVVAVEYSTVNWKDGACMGSGGGMVRNYPHVPGVDFSGTVESSTDPRYKQGDKVILTGWRVGEAYWGGYSQKASVKADWLVPLPSGLTTKQAMAVGTAGFSAMLALQALEDQGLKIDEGPVLVTGAAGGVGSMATTILAHAGYEVAAVTGRPEAAEYLKDLGASQIVQRSELNEVIKRPMEAATWAGCVDAVGGEMLARLLGQLKYGASVAVVGNASGTAVPANVIPFLLRGINMLGIDSAAQPYANRVRAWDRITSDLPLDKLDAMMTEATLEDLPSLGRDIQNGKIKGRVVVDVNK